MLRQEYFTAYLSNITDNNTIDLIYHALDRLPDYAIAALSEAIMDDFIEDIELEGLCCAGMSPNNILIEYKKMNNIE